MSAGLVHALLLDGHGGAAFLDDAADALNRASSDSNLLWLHFDYTDPSAQHWLTEHSGLGPVSVDALLAPETRTRVTTRYYSLLIYPHGVNNDPTVDP